GGHRSLSKTATYIKTVKVGQIDVEKKNVDTFACEFQGLLSGDSLGDVEAGCLQNSRSRIKRSWIVVNYQNSRCCGVGHSSHLQISNSSHPAYRRAGLSKRGLLRGKAIRSPRHSLCPPFPPPIFPGAFSLLVHSP